MGATELTRLRDEGLVRGRREGTAAKHARRIGASYAGLWTLSLLGAAAGPLLPALAPATNPHPVQHGTLGDFAAIAATNARVLSAPFLLALFRFPRGPRSRRLGDALLLVLLGGNALRVGLALGRDGQTLLPYLPQLPLEWLASALSAAAWLTLRQGSSKRTALRYATAILLLLTAAAAMETLGTPHLPPSAGRA